MPRDEAARDHADWIQRLAHFVGLRAVAAPQIEIMLAAGETGVADFIRSVTSAKGTTAEGLAVLEKSALRTTMRRTIAAAARRSRELSALA